MQTAQLTIPDGVTIQLDGNLKETITGQVSANTGLLALGSIAVKGFGQFQYNEDGSAQAAAITVATGRVDISGVTFTSPNPSSRMRYAIRVNTTGSQTITSMQVHDTFMTGVEYGVIRSTSLTGVVQELNISDNQFYDMIGDPVEWNIGPADGPITITGNTIDYIHTNATNEGLGIGIAGNAPYAYPPANPQQRILIANNNIRRVPQGVHCELCNQVKVVGNRISEVNSSYGTSVDNTGITIAGSFNVTIDDNTITESVCSAGNCIIASDGVSGTYVPSTENLVITNNKLLNTNASNLTGILSVVGRPDTNTAVTEPSNVVIKGNVIINGYIQEIGVNNLTISDNVVTPPVGAIGLNIQYNGVLPSGPTTRYSLTIKNNQVRDVLGNVKVSITGTADPYGFRNVNLFGGGNSFALTPMSSGGVAVTPYTYSAGNTYVTNSTTFPLGPNFQVGDIVYSLGGPQIWVVTGAGTNVPAGETFAIDVAASGTIYQTGGTFFGDVFQYGQLIHLSDGTHTADAVVDSIYWSGAHSAGGIALLNPSNGAVLNLGSMGAGTITATTAVTYTAGPHGSAGTQVQLSDGTGTSGYSAKFASDGSMTNGLPIAGSGAAIATGPISGTDSGPYCHLFRYGGNAARQRRSLQRDTSGEHCSGCACAHNGDCKRACYWRQRYDADYVNDHDEFMDYNGSGAAFSSDQHYQIGTLHDFVADVEHIVHGDVRSGHGQCPDQRMGRNTDGLCCGGQLELACIHTVEHEHDRDFGCDNGGSDGHNLCGADRFCDPDRGYRIQ